MPEIVLPVCLASLQHERNHCSLGKKSFLGHLCYSPSSNVSRYMHPFEALPVPQQIMWSTNCVWHVIIEWLGDGFTSFRGIRYTAELDHLSRCFYSLSSMACLTLLDDCIACWMLQILNLPSVFLFKGMIACGWQRWCVQIEVACLLLWNILRGVIQCYCLLATLSGTMLDSALCSFPLPRW